MLEHSDGLIAMAILGSARGSRAGFGGLAETIGRWQ
jgi:predicted component of type VI protein secretion system